MAVLYSEREIRGALGDSTYAKAVSYVASDKVQLVGQGEPDGLNSVVAGSGKSLYRQKIKLTRYPDGRLRVDGECTCPMNWNCKHVAAALITWARQQGNQTSIDHSQKVPSSPQLQHSVTSWLDAIDQARRQSPKSQTQPRERLLYRLYVHRALAKSIPDLQLEVVKTTIPKLGKPTPPGRRYHYQSTNWRNPPAFITPVDEEIVRDLMGLRAMHSYGTYSTSDILRHDRGEVVLRKILSSGRCVWGDEHQTIAAWSEPRAGRFRWQLIDQEGMKLDLGLDSDENGVAIVRTTRPLFIDTKRGVAGPLEVNLAPDVVDRMLSAPIIPPVQISHFQVALNARPELGLPIPDKGMHTPVEIDEDPVAILRLTSVKRHTATYSYMRGAPPVQETHAVGRLQFSYGPVLVSEKDTHLEINRLEAGRLLSVRRHLEQEAAAHKVLHDFGFVRDVDPWDRPPRSGTWDYVPEEGAIDWYSILYEDVPALEALGFRVEIDDDFPYRVHSPDGSMIGSLIPRESDGIDWFDLALGVHVGGKYVDLIEPLLSLIDDTSLLTPGDPDETVPLFLAMDDGSVLALPVEPLRPLVEGLKRLFAGRARAGPPRLSLYDALAFSELVDAGADSGLGWQNADALVRLGRALKDVGRIEDVALPETFTATLRPYQVRGVAWMQFLRSVGLGGILADDMGLGKTIQALAFIAIERAQGRLTAPVLIIAPTSLMANWAAEAAAFVPDLKVVTFQGPSRLDRLNAFDAADIVLTTYPLLSRDKALLIEREWSTVILDEAQSIKNAASSVSRLVRELHCATRFCLTGTPLENHLGEVWSLITFLMPGFLGTIDQFNKQWRTPIERQGDVDRGQILARKLRPFILRRTKSEVARDLPPRSLIEERVTLEAAQRQKYETIRLAMHGRVREAIRSRGLNASQIVILDALLKLRQICCDPSLVREVQDEFVEVKTSAKTKRSPRIDAQTSASAKRERLMELLDELMAEDRKVLVFSQFTSMLDLIEASVKERQWAYSRLTGETRDRPDQVRRFQSGETNLFLISLKAGGVGLNLTAADTVILYDPWWNGAVEDQAIDRAHRIGQTQPVFVYRLIAADTIEEKMGTLKARKKALANGLLSEDLALADTMTEADVEALFEA